MKCPSCSVELPDGSRFCSACGSATMPTGEVDGATVARPASATPRSTPSSGSGSGRRDRFIPGTLLGDRFRIVAPLGRGGMGEVFRAEDLKLAQPVALKFLPPGMANDTDRLARLYAEVRVARQIAHPNVCRVYDIGEVSGEHFISMEYIEGEDLTTLLRRIGRFPEAKALQIARQVCAGLAAAHDKSVLHRDLKPANIMLDERGTARITDFGLSSLVEDTEKAKAIEGTPAYMAPEQLTGEGASVRSDVYALGLVLYEVFTGRRAFETNSIPELMRQRSSQASVPTPSSVSPDINPAIERVILHCLESDPQNRPSSAVAVAAALPGGDPLAAALAAGETPSPELLAAAGHSGGMKPMYAVACLIAVVLSVFAIAAARDAQDGAVLASMPRSPQQLAARAREIATRLGYKEQPYSAYGFTIWGDYSKYVKEHDKSKRKWQRLSKGHPSYLFFWYRESPRVMVPRSFFSDGEVTAADPPNNRTGGFRLLLEPSGSLIDFEAPTPQIAEPGPPQAIDWTPVIELAGYVPNAMKQVAPRWTPLLWGDTRAAWETKSPEQPDINVRIEASGFHGRVTSIESIYPWEKPLRDVEPEMKLREKVTAAIAFTLIGTMVLVACLLARRNIVLGRGDRRGAFRFAFVVTMLRAFSVLLGASHVFSLQEIAVVIPCIASALLSGAAAWLVYVAIEPYTRRRWPQTLLSWNRLLLGQFRDPMVGRDVLIGITGAALMIALYSGASLIDQSNPPVIAPDFLLGPRYAVAAIFSVLTGTSISAIATYLLLFIFRVIFRRDWLAAGIIIVLNATVAFAVGNWLSAIVSIIGNVVALTLLLRFGVVVLLAWNFVGLLVSAAPVTLRVTAWYGGTTLFVFGVVLAVTIWAFRTALAGRPLFSEALLEH